MKALPVVIYFRVPETNEYSERLNCQSVREAIRIVKEYGLPYKIYSEKTNKLLFEGWLPKY